MSFFAELRRRNVFKVGVAYAIVAWLIVQVVSAIHNPLHLPDWFDTVVILLLIIGFILAIIFAWAFELTPEGIKATTTTGPDQYHTQTTGQRLNYFIIGVLVLVVAFLLGKDFVLKESPEVADEASAPSAVRERAAPEKTNEDITEPSAPPNSIAVLPFTNMSSDPEQEYFADGIAEELLNSLARIKGLEVRGRTSSFYFKGKKEDLHSISEMLNVEYIIEGSVRKAGEQVRITVQLINTRTDNHIWSETYERTMDDIFAIQDQIASAVVQALEISLGVAELSHLPGMTRNVRAYDAYLKAVTTTPLNWRKKQSDWTRTSLLHGTRLENYITVVMLLFQEEYWTGKPNVIRRMHEHANWFRMRPMCLVPSQMKVRYRVTGLRQNTFTPKWRLPLPDTV